MLRGLTCGIAELIDALLRRFTRITDTAPEQAIALLKTAPVQSCRRATCWVGSGGLKLTN